MDKVEEFLVSSYKISANAGHPNHRGNPREAFIKEFLQAHLNQNVSISSGEIIDFSSQPRVSRSQHDIVIYKNNYPKLDFGKGTYGFLIESVIATIEIKSLLDQAGIDQSVKAAHEAKSLVPNVVNAMQSGWVPPKILNFVVAYMGPAQMSTVHSWILNAHQNKNIPLPQWDQNTKFHTAGSALDGVFVLQKGFLKLDNTPLTFNNGETPYSGLHLISDSPEGNLLYLFLCLQESLNNINGSWLNPLPYVSSAQYKNVRIL